MSRTDKDLPHWVRAEWWKPLHSISCRYRKSEPCDLPNGPILANPNTFNNTKCYWWLGYDFSILSKVPKWYVDYVWWNPQRRTERDILRDAVKDHRANGDTDIEVWCYPARNCAKWYYW